MIPSSAPQPMVEIFGEMSCLWIAKPLKPLIHSVFAKAFCFWSVLSGLLL